MDTLSSDINYEIEFWIISPFHGFNKCKWITTRENKDKNKKNRYWLSWGQSV